MHVQNAQRISQLLYDKKNCLSLLFLCGKDISKFWENVGIQRFSYDIRKFAIINLAVMSWYRQKTVATNIFKVQWICKFYYITQLKRSFFIFNYISVKQCIMKDYVHYDQAFLDTYICTYICVSSNSVVISRRFLIPYKNDRIQLFWIS